MCAFLRAAAVPAACQRTVVDSTADPRRDCCGSLDVGWARTVTGRQYWSLDEAAHGHDLGRASTVRRCFADRLIVAATGPSPPSFDPVAASRGAPPGSRRRQPLHVEKAHKRRTRGPEPAEFGGGAEDVAFTSEPRLAQVGRVWTPSRRQRAREQFGARPCLKPGRAPSSPCAMPHRARSHAQTNKHPPLRPTDSSQDPGIEGSSNVD